MLLIARAFSLALARAGNSSPARIAMIAITTSSSIKVKARRQQGRRVLIVTARENRPFALLNESRRGRACVFWGRTGRIWGGNRARQQPGMPGRIRKTENRRSEPKD